MSSLSSLLAAALIAGAACAGCSVHGRAYPVGYTELYYGDAYGYYPHTWYGGRDVYYIGNRWMYRDGGGWRYYASEPPALYRYRSTVRQAPPAYSYPRGGGHGYPGGGYGPAPRGPSYGAPHGAPPPTRVR
jgi:hypothetical protein